MLIAPLCDKVSGAIIIAATAHLKAKAGLKNDAIRDHQVLLHLGQLKCACTFLEYSLSKSYVHIG